MTYPAQLTNPPQTNAAVVVNENGKAIRHVAVYANDFMTTSGLARGYIGGRWGGFAVADATHTFGASTTTYVSVARADGTLNFSTSSTNYNDSTNYAKVETVVTDASSVTSVTDDRAGPGGAHGSGGGSGQTVTALSISSGVVNIDLSLGNFFTLALSANVTSFTFSNLPGSGKGFSIWIEIVQNASAAKTVTLSGFKWAGGIGTTSVSTALSAVDELALTSVDNGTTVKATLAKAWS